jgi:hypothetical protein
MKTSGNRTTNMNSAMIIGDHARIISAPYCPSQLEIYEYINIKNMVEED